MTQRIIIIVSPSYCLGSVARATKSFIKSYVGSIAKKVKNVNIAHSNKVKSTTIDLSFSLISILIISSFDV